MSGPGGCGCVEAQDCQSTLRFTILPRRTFREGDLRHRDLWPGRRGAQRIDTRDPRAAEASRDESLVSHACSTRHAGETAYARREHVQRNVTFLDNPKHALQARRWRFVYCAIKHIACVSRLAVVATESQRASGGIFATLQHVGCRGERRRRRRRRGRRRAFALR